MKTAAEHATYMREYTRRKKAEDPVAYREAVLRCYERNRSQRCREARLLELRKRSGVDEATEGFISVLQGDPCAYCGCQTVPLQRTQGNGAALDHIDPDGDSNWTNLAGACRSCNAVKGKLPLLLSMLERQLRRDLTPVAEQIFAIKGRTAQRRRIDF